MSAGSKILEKVLQADPAMSEARGQGPELLTEDAPVDTESRPTDPSNARSRGVNGSIRVAGWDPKHFAEQQIRSLVQRVFFPGWPQPARQVVFSTVDDGADGGGTCARVCIAMAEQLPGTVCAVEVDRTDAPLARFLGQSEAGDPFLQ
jgi:hypothetical protein